MALTSATEAAGRFENGLQVLEHAGGLLGDSAGDHLWVAGSSAIWPAVKMRLPRANGLRVGTYGGGRGSGRNDGFAHA